MDKGPASPALLQRFPLHSDMLTVLEEVLIRQEYDHSDLRFSSRKVIDKNRIVDIVQAPKIQKKMSLDRFLKYCVSSS